MFFTKTQYEVDHKRLLRKLRKKDQKIQGLQKRVKELESLVIKKAFDVSYLKKDIESIVTSALCNIRMIPVIGLGRDARIVEVKAFEKEKE